jgi:RimJ/RimL family protein N-acetyltransferase
VRATSDARNAPSIRLLQRLGFAHTGTREAVFEGQACVEWDFERGLQALSQALDSSGDASDGLNR